jgi:hypothetical protein
MPANVRRSRSCREIPLGIVRARLRACRANRNFNLGRGRTFLLPGTHSIRRPFEEVGSAYGCLYFGSSHIVADGVAHTDKSNGNARFPQRFDETK